MVKKSEQQKPRFYSYLVSPKKAADLLNIPLERFEELRITHARILGERVFCPGESMPYPAFRFSNLRALALELDPDYLLPLEPGTPYGRRYLRRLPRAPET